MSSGGWFNGMVSDDDMPWLLLLGVLAAPSVVAMVPSLRDEAVGRAVEWHVLAPASAELVWTIPGGIGGFDGRRLLLALLIVVVAAVVAGVAVRARQQRSVEEQLVTGDLNKPMNK